MAAPMLTLLNRIAPKYVTTTEQVGRAMIKVARDGYPKPVWKARTSPVLARHSGDVARPE